MKKIASLGIIAALVLVAGTVTPVIAQGNSGNNNSGQGVINDIFALLTGEFGLEAIFDLLTVVDANVDDLGTNLGIVDANVDDLGTNLGIVDANVDDLGTNLGIIGTDVSDIELKLDDKREFQLASKSSTAFAGQFNIATTCDKDFEVKSVVARAFDPDDTIDITYNQVFVGGNFGNGFDNYFIKDTNFNPGQDEIGQELLSNMELRSPIVVPAGGTLQIVGNVANTDGDDFLNAAAAIDTAPDAICTVNIVG